jgi:hypothetical protein
MEVYSSIAHPQRSILNQSLRGPAASDATGAHSVPQLVGCVWFWLMVSRKALHLRISVHLRLKGFSLWQAGAPAPDPAAFRFLSFLVSKKS